MKKFDLKKLEGLKEEKFQIPREEQELLRGGYNEGYYTNSIPQVEVSYKTVNVTNSAGDSYYVEEVADLCTYH